MSNISFQGINEQFPVAGQDNDTQVFRDNFDTIKQGLRVANEEITDLQENTARIDQDTDYGLTKIQNAVLENVRMQKLLAFSGSNVNASPATIDFQQGHYQIFKIGSGSGADPFIFEFLNFPGDPSLFGSSGIGMGRVIVELYSDGQPRTIAFRTSETTVIKKNNFPLLPVGNIGDLIISSDSDPVFLEIWRWSPTSIYVKYLGVLDAANTQSFASGSGTSGPLLVKGTVATFLDLPPDPETGDVYLVQDPTPTKLYSWNVNQWIDLGTFQGPQGPRGFIGLQGTQGIQGVQGNLGIQGNQGTQGLDGLFAGQGLQGPQGTQGFQGFQGTFGTQGAQGTQGFQGTAGLFAGQGIQGISGSQGIQGRQGIQGNNGAFVSQGIQGVQGVQGVVGASLNIKGEVENASFLPPDPELYDAYINRADGELYLWDGDSWVSIGQVVGPQGSQGIQGTQGTQGPQGSQGLQGTLGTQGTFGTQGTQGEQGTQGTQGTQGELGTQGILGVQGIQGTLGFQGFQGTNLINTSALGGIGGGTLTIDLAESLIKVTLDQNITAINFINAPATGIIARTLVVFTQDGAGGKTVAGSGYQSPGGTGLAVSSAASTVSLAEFIAFDGSVYLGTLNGSNYS